MRPPSRVHPAILCAAAALLGACADQTITGPGSEAELGRNAPPRTATTAAASGATCEAITFDGVGFSHGSPVSSVTVFGATLTVRSAPYQDEPNPFRLPRTYSTDNKYGYEDVDMQWDGYWDGPNGRVSAVCSACRGLGNVLVIEDQRGFNPWGDSRWGGFIIFEGFPAGQFWVESFAAVDDDHEEPAIQLLVDGSVLARSSGLGNGSVETVRVGQAVPIQRDLRFEFGTPALDMVTGSGAIDDIRLCRAAATNPGTGTIGYWKNHPSAWPVETIRVGGVTYSKSQAIAIMSTPGKGDMRYQMFAQLVAAKLNVLIGNESSCIASTIAQADAWMAQHTPFASKPAVKASSAAWSAGGPLHDRLDAYNNGRLCAPHRG